MKKMIPVFNGKNVAVYHWSPPARTNYKNFGDEIAPMIVKKMLDKNGFTDIDVVAAEKDRNKIIAVGSVLHQAVTGDIVWGGGVNGKNWPSVLANIEPLEISLVRGPLTRKALSYYNHFCPENYGDPGLIFPLLFSEEIGAVESTLNASKFADVIFVPNLNDDRFLDQTFAKSLKNVKYTNPSHSPLEIAAIISKARLVLSSSLHGIVFSDYYSVPVIPVLSYFEPIFKYIDYFQGTDRDNVRIAINLDEALNLQPIPKAKFCVESIISSFPINIMNGESK